MVNDKWECQWNRKGGTIYECERGGMSYFCVGMEGIVMS